jgi:hypothetical protein
MSGWSGRKNRINAAQAVGFQAGAGHGASGGDAHRAYAALFPGDAARTWIYNTNITVDPMTRFQMFRRMFDDLGTTITPGMKVLELFSRFLYGVR